MKGQMQDLPQKLELAAKTLVHALALSVADSALMVFTGISEEIKALPSVTMVAISGDEFPQDSGNFRITFTAVVATNANDTTLAEHRQLCEDALAPLMDETTATDLSEAIEDFACMGISNRQSRGLKEDTTWITELSFDAYCCGVALA